MKNSTTLMLALLSTCSLEAQNISFELIPSNFIDYEIASIEASDIDGDGDQDLIIAGFDVNAFYPDDIVRKLTLYRNNGDGEFTIEPIEGSGVEEGLKVLDLDSDGDDDLFCAGWSSDNQEGYTVRAALNDGNGNFTFYDSGVPLSQVTEFEFADVDNDGDQDLLTMGRDQEENLSTTLYLNDGNAVFTEVLDSNFIGLEFGSILFSDFDGDGDQDVFLTGLAYVGDEIIYDNAIYLNDGTAGFEMVATLPFESLHSMLLDVENDGDQDLLIYDTKVQVYTNDGLGNFEEGTVLVSYISFGKMAVVDIDDDGDQDVLVNGKDAEFSTSLYLNDGNGGFDGEDIAVEQGRIGAMTFADVAGDAKQDLIMVGCTEIDDSTSRVYTNFSEAGSGMSISENTFVAGVQIYPNPVQDEWHIRFSEPQNDVILQVYSVDGQKLKEYKYESLQQLDYQLSYASGLYLYRIIAGDQHASGMLLKE